ncbi:hypothetical protein F4813DRAFT_394506 [Daldinia decipiens]|uniref:uncharacterized protein n=1 Tax=Daldinia decipiens TaxID=326647 RepID=UPI0020C2B930|nr:uncharacterized protein F4813DRAFT_394506 [Daldinia decipiens]KAI1652616.1 hypothetical protein F4813DRAFT_394506 [Daldinia decipiens]
MTMNEPDFMRSRIDREINELQDWLVGRLDPQEAIQRPAIIDVQCYPKSDFPREIENFALGSERAPYTHQKSQILCVFWHLFGTFGYDVHHKDHLHLLEPTRKKTIIGRTAKLYPLYDGEKPIDFHFLINYHFRELEMPDIEVPQEDTVVWWPNIIVYLSEVYRTMVQMDQTSQDAMQRFFGFFARPYVRMQEYWIMIDEKVHNRPTEKDFTGGPDAIDQIYENKPDGEMRIKLRNKFEAYISRDVSRCRLEDIIAVNDVEGLTATQKRRLRTVAAYLKFWGDSAPVTPRAVRYARPGEKSQGEPATIIDLVHKLDMREPNDRIGPKFFPAISPR